MPIYVYECSENGCRVELLHPMGETFSTWGQLCARAGRDLGSTPPDSPVCRVPSAPSLSFPKTHSDLKNMGFTKLVKRDSGVYENVTATDGESRYVRRDDPSTLPNLKKKIGD